MMTAICYDFYECVFLLLRFNSVQFFMVIFNCLYLGSVPVERLETQDKFLEEYIIGILVTICAQLLSRIGYSRR
jgi:hypothetical protein